jgi:hypothetical protein
MTNERKPQERYYASKAKVRQYVEVARELGIEVGGFEVTTDGTIRVMAVAAMQPQQPAVRSAYDEWKAADRLKEARRTGFTAKCE